MSAVRSLTGGERTSAEGANSVAFDPLQTFTDLMKYLIWLTASLFQVSSSRNYTAHGLITGAWNAAAGVSGSAAVTWPATRWGWG